MNANTMNKYLEEERTVYGLSNKDVNVKLHIFGLLIYIIFFVIMIPYILIKYKLWTILAAYFPNLDLLATSIGYHGGPNNSNIWKYLYNPNNITLIGYHTSIFINYMSLLGVAFIIAEHTLKTRDVYQGLSIAIFIFPLTYLIPNNIVARLMNRFGKFLNNFYSYDNLIHYLLTVIVGLIISIGFIIMEAISIYYLSKPLAKLFNKIYRL